MDESKLKEIKAVEKQAVDILEKAKADYSKTISEAAEQGVTLMNEAKQKSRTQYQDTLQDFRKKGEKEAASILENLETELKTIQKSGKLKEKAAADYLKKAIKEKYGNS